MSVAGFRYQAGDTREIAEEIAKSGSSQVDIHSEDELEQVCEELEEYGLVLDSAIAFEYDALDLEDYPNFYARAFFSEDKWIDFFMVSPGDPAGEDKGKDDFSEVYW